MSSLFRRGFKSSKCKTLLRLAMARIKLLRNKRDIQIKQMRKDVAQLLTTKQEASARIRVEHVAREQNIVAAYDLIELFCELIIVRLPIIESQKFCPPDLKEAIASLIFASPRCADLPELLQLRFVFASKYGKEFGAGAAELRPDCGVNRRLVEKLSVRAPPGETKLSILKEIAAEHKLHWDAAESAAELLKLPDDLLEGPTKFFGPSQVPIPEQNHPSLGRTQSLPDELRASVISPPVIPDLHARPALLTRLSSLQISSSESELQNSPADINRPFIPFARRLQPGVASAEKPVSPSTAPVNDLSPQNRVSKAGKYASPMPNSNSHCSPRPRKDGPAGFEKASHYQNIVAAADAAAESADRAVAAARAAAQLAKSYSSKRESSSNNRNLESSSSDDDGDCQERSIGNRHQQSGQPLRTIYTQHRRTSH